MTQAPSSFFSATAWKQRLVFWCGAILVGVFISALTVLSEHTVTWLRDFLQRFPWALFVICPLGMILVTGLTDHFFPGAERSGVPQVRVALAIHHDLQLRNRFVSFRIAVGKVLLTNLGLLTGSSAGLGGPAIQIGASLMTALGKAARFPPHYLERGLILAGSAAGFAALFSAPLAGIIFAIEELGRSFEEKIGSLVLTAIILAGMTAFILLNHYVFLEAGEVPLPRGGSWLAIPVCGIIGGLAGGLFSALMIQSGRWMSQRAWKSRVATLFFSGLVLAGVHFISHGTTLGTGYPMLKNILSDPQTTDPAFAALKATATFFTALSGMPAGLFVPTLSAGAGLGADLLTWLPFAPPLAVVLLTMCGYFAGMFQNPMTSFVLVMEMTDTHELLLPLMATAFIASGTSRLLSPQPLYETMTAAYAKRLQENA